MRMLRYLLPLLLVTTLAAEPEPEYFRWVPDAAPRTWVPHGKQEAFVAYSKTPEGAHYFERIRHDYETYWSGFVVPSQPDKYGDPDPRKRTSEKVVLWRGAQDVCNQISTIAETATLLWLVTGEEPYRDHAKRILLDVCGWDPDGVSNIYYNDEAHFRLWRKLPEVYDQLRDSFTPEEKERILASFRERGKRSVAWIKESGIEKVRRNSVAASPSSHPVRFMAMTGIAALALWDDLPEAKEWYQFVYEWYRDVFTPWGGKDGGWAEGPAYWRGVYEHANFQDALLLIGDPLAYQSPFWRETGYFQVYFVQPYFSTNFGDLSNAGKFDLEPGVAHFLNHLAKVQQNGYFRSYVSLYEDERPLPQDESLKDLIRLYPTVTEHWLRDFLGAQFPEPEARPLSELPSSRFFEDVGWVSFHSALGDPANDIQISFKSSPYGSFSHSHADQNAFIMNAFGENLAINSGYREYHRSPHHAFYTRETRSKNAVLINHRGQEVQNKASTGEIIHYEVGDRYVWAAGEAAPAYQLMQNNIDLESVRRDLIFVDQRYLIVRDRVVADDPFQTSWLLHTERPMAVNADMGAVYYTNQRAHLGVRVEALNGGLRARTWSGFDVAVDPAYVDPEGVEERPWLTAPNVDQFHLRFDLKEYQSDSTVFAVLYPSRKSGDLAALELEVVDQNTVIVHYTDGGDDRITFSDDGSAVSVE